MTMTFDAALNAAMSSTSTTVTPPSAMLDATYALDRLAYEPPTDVVSCLCSHPVLFAGRCLDCDGLPPVPTVRLTTDQASVYRTGRPEQTRALRLQLLAEAQRLADAVEDIVDVVLPDGSPLESVYPRSVR